MTVKNFLVGDQAVRTGNLDSGKEISVENQKNIAAIFFDGIGIFLLPVVSVPDFNPVPINRKDGITVNIIPFAEQRTVRTLTFRSVFIVSFVVVFSGS